MPDISGGDPAFRADDGAVAPGVSAALEEFAAGQGSEHAAMTALAASRLLVPIVAHASAHQKAGEKVSAGEKASEMALPTLIGADGRPAIPAFTCADTMRAWQADARPVPVTARALWQAAVEGSSAVVIDVAGPVRFVVEGARLAALARGEAAPFPWADADVREVVAAVVATHPEVASFELGPGGGDRDLAIDLTPAESGVSREVGERAVSMSAEVMAMLGDRLRGVEVWLAEWEEREIGVVAPRAKGRGAALGFCGGSRGRPLGPAGGAGVWRRGRAGWAGSVPSRAPRGERD